MDLSGRNLLTVTDLSREEFLHLVELGRQLRADKRQGLTGRRLAGRNIALIFEKSSTRTRSAFEVAAHDEGGHVTYLGPGESQLGHKESVKDTARVLGRMFDGIEYRGFAQESAETLGEFAGVPVWNGLTDVWHPTQMLADILTSPGGRACVISQTVVDPSDPAFGPPHQVHRGQLRQERSAGAGRTPGVDHRGRRAPLAARGGLAQATGAGGDRDRALPG